MIPRRAFADLPGRQVHYRVAGSGRPLVLLHAGPGSARQLVPLIAALGDVFHAIAPDMPGNGDSDPLPMTAPSIADHAAALIPLLDALKLDRVDIYGSHTGAAIAAELAILSPDRVGRVIMDGLGVFDAAQRDDLLLHYAHPFAPDLDGAYLMKAFHFLRDQYLFFPWYDRSPGAWRGSGLRPAGELHQWLVEVLKANDTYHLAYRAAFGWPAIDRLPLVGRPVLMTAASNDPLNAGTRSATSLLADGRFQPLPRFDDPGFAEARLELIGGFLAER